MEDYFEKALTGIDKEIAEFRERERVRHRWFKVALWTYAALCSVTIAWLLVSVLGGGRHG